ncbi:MAG: VWA domain-containing protein [Phycisphaerae bacterium]|nr:VWA domain-containing protein [Phycisphaerae bacterium]
MSWQINLSGRRLVLAWVVSLAVHVALFVSMFSLPWLAGKVAGGAELPVPQTELVDPTDTTRTTLVNPEPDFGRLEQPETLQPRLTPRQIEPSVGVGQPRQRDLSLIGLGAGGGDFGKYGLGVGSGDAGPQFFGLGGSARGTRRVVYVVDRSGSMISTFSAVRRELKRSVGRLRRSMRFHVILFNSGPPLENPPRKLIHASRPAKAGLTKFLDTVYPEGNTDPIPAMRRAFAVKPEVIYFLTDGEFDRQLLDELRKWNKGKQVRIFTIAYVSPGGAELLEQIAHEHNGQYRFISEYDL